MGQRDDTLIRGEGAAILSTVLFAVMAVMVKLSSAHLSGVVISFFRFALGGLLAAGGILLFRQTFRPSGWFAVLMRAFLGSVSMIIYYQAIALTGGGRATLLNNLYPFFVALFGGLFFGERFSPARLLFMGISFAGTVLIFWDGSHYPLLGNALAVLSALIVGVSVNFMKKAREGNGSLLLYFWICLFGTLFSAPFLPAALPALRVLPAREWLLVTGAAVVVFAAQFFFTWGQKYMTAVRNSFLSFLKIPLTLLLGFLLLGETMTERFWIGCLLVAAGLLLDTFVARRNNDRDRSDESGEIRRDPRPVEE